MPMPAYPVLCHAPGCGRPASHKIAARWSDGQTAELKTYGMACADCLASLLADARERQGRCRLAPGETLDPVGAFRWDAARADRELVPEGALGL